MRSTSAENPCCGDRASGAGPLHDERVVTIARRGKGDERLGPLSTSWRDGAPSTSTGPTRTARALPLGSWIDDGEVAERAALRIHRRHTIRDSVVSLFERIEEVRE